MKYLVMECHNSYAILLDETGQFVKAANRHYTVGQTVTDPVLMREAKQRHSEFGFSIKTRHALASAAAVCMLFLCTGVYQAYMMPYTSVVLSINPSIQMELNRKGNVVELIGLNNDGILLLDGYHMSSKDRLIVTDELIDRAIDLGYLHAGGQIVIQIDTPDEALFQQYGVELRTSVADSLSEHTETVNTVTVQITQTQKTPAGPSNHTPDVDEHGDWFDDDDDFDDDFDNDFDDDDVLSQSTPTNGQTSDRITLDEAEAIALNHANVRPEDVRFDDKEFNIDDGVPLYELEFTANGAAYEYDIHAESGNILKAEYEYNEDDDDNDDDDDDEDDRNDDNDDDLDDDDD